MAGFKTHVTFSSLLGCGYAGAGCVYGMPLDSALVGGAMCGFSGMLPDLDSDYGTPLREIMSFASATIPMLLLRRFASFHLTHDQIVLLAVGMYLFMRFGVTNMIRKYTVHRGMFHSIPAGMIFAGLAFLICGTSDLDVRYFKAGGVGLGFFSHLLLDEIYSVEWKGGRWRLKKSFGTALKLWGHDPWSNFSTYAKLVVVAAIIVSEPSVMRQLEARHPEFAQGYHDLQNEYQSWSGGFSPASTFDSLRDRIRGNLTSPTAGQPPTNLYPPQQPAQAPVQPRSYQDSAAPNSRFNTPPSQWPTQPAGEEWNTAQRPGWPNSQ